MRRLLLLAALLGATPAAAQDDTQAWLNVTATGRIKDRLIYFAEVQARVGEDVSRLNQFILRPAIGVQVSKRVAVYQGYMHVTEPIENGRNRYENRSFQQVTWNVAEGRFGQLQSRTRFEQRWLNTGDDTGFRLRQLARWELPLQKKQHALAALAHVEGFVALNRTDWGQPAGLDQVRMFAGAEIPLFGASTLEAGYLAQALNRDVNRVNHIASLTFFLRH